MSASATDRKRVGRTQWIPKIPPITERMREIHAAFCAGESGRQIGRRLGVSQHWIQQVIRRVHEANREARLEMVREGRLACEKYTLLGRALANTSTRSRRP